MTDADLLPLSALQHLAFCERQWGLIHLEQQWVDNGLTAEGHLLHGRADAPGASGAVKGVRVARGLRVRSLRLGLTGQADVVEFHPATAAGGSPRPFPVEYKRGRPKANSCDEVQLCAQALCLEEMLGVPVPEGALFYGEPRRRTPILFDAALRGETEALAARLHALMGEGRTPVARYESKCRGCSLQEVCLPKATGSRRSAQAWLDGAVEAAVAGVGETLP